MARKGHELFVRAAANLPDIQFTLIGGWKDNNIEHLRWISPENVTFTGWLDSSKLLEYFKNASVYVQASAHEGFGLSVAEAMLAGCVPVVSRRGSLPEVVGDSGFYVENLDPENLAQAIERGLQAPQSFRREARERILSQFSVKMHDKKMKKVVEDIMQAYRK